MGNKDKQLAHAHNLANKLIRQMKDRESIIYLLGKKHAGELDELDKDSITSIVDKAIQSFDSYNYLQKIYRSKIITPNSGEQWQLYDTLENTAEPANEKNIRRLVDKSVDLTPKYVVCSYRFNPFSKPRITEVEGLKYFNTYNPPAWLKQHFYYNEPLPVGDVIPALYSEFFSHLFDGDEKSILYAIKWIANALQSRNVCFLATIGKSGIGKGTLGEIFRGVMGEEHYLEMKFQSISKNFNGQMKDKRLIYLDEAYIKLGEQEDTLKMLANDYIEIEKKNHQAETVRNYASIYLSSNHTDSIKLKHDDRRFSILNLTDIPIRKVWTESKRQELFKKDNIAELACYLYQLPIDRDEMTEPFVSARTQMIKSASLSAWEDFFLNVYCAQNAGKEVSLTEVQNTLKGEVNSKGVPSKNSFLSLQDKFTKIFRVTRPEKSDGSRPVQLSILPIHEQDRAQLSDLATEES